MNRLRPAGGSSPAMTTEIVARHAGHDGGEEYSPFPHDRACRTAAGASGVEKNFLQKRPRVGRAIADLLYPHCLHCLFVWSRSIAAILQPNQGRRVKTR